MIFAEWNGSDSEFSEISQRVTDNIQDLRNNWTQAVRTKANIGDLGDLGSSMKSAAWTELKFNTGEEEIVFKGREIRYLKEMLSEYIKENYPEEML